MFKSKFAGILCIFLVVFLNSCSNNVVENNYGYYLLSSVKASENQVGSLKIESGSRAINAEELKFAKISVSGSGIQTSAEPSSDFTAMTNGSGSAAVENIPVGSNRIVTAYAYDSSKAKVGTTMVRNVVDIKAGANTCSLDKSTTALGNVFASLLASGYDISSISAAQKNQISNAIENAVSWTMIDSAAIASDFKNGSLKSSVAYVLQSARAAFVNNLENAKIQIGDPVSAVKNAESGSGSIENVAPGTWPVYIIQNNKIVKKTFATFVSGSTTDLGTFGSAVTDRIIVHIEKSSGYKNIYAWDSETEEVFGAWPGTAMEDTDGDGWYDAVIEKTSCNLIFNGNGQTSNLSREAGEWWYKDGEWQDYNPNDSTAPVLISFTADKSGTVSGNVTFTVSASDDKALKSAVVKIGDKIIKTMALSGTMVSESFVWDSTDVGNGTYNVSCAVYDAGENIAEDIGTVNLTVNNANVPPVAVISGAGRADPNSESMYSASSSYDKHGTVTGYQWSVTGGATIKSGATSVECNISFPATEDSECTVTLKVKDAEGLWSDPVSMTVKVKTKVSNDFREQSIYFLMTARFYDGDSSNNRWCRSDMDGSSGNKANNDYPWRGDFKGLIEKLDYIKAMGFSAVWITPPVLNRSDFDFHGYHAWNMNKIDSRLESAGATYQDLINACHEKGIKVIQDIVLNHSSRYGLEDLFVPKHYGSKSITWGNGKGIGAEYYDDFNPDFTYNGLDAEPNSGKTFYNGDLWQEAKPTNLWWNPDLSDWGVLNQQYNYYLCQWPTLKLFDPNYFHQKWLGNWEDETCQSGTIHEDCIDLNTENAAVQKYLIDAYTRYIEMGVDAFRIDTVKHVSRVMFNRHFIPAFKAAGGENFYMFGEVCTRVNEVWNHGVAPLSTPFYTWKERSEYSADDSVAVHEGYEYEKNMGPNNQPVSDNHALTGAYGNDYHKPDYSQASGLNVIDFPMHWNFSNASQAYGMRGQDYNYNDATWNVVYVDSHDYGPNMDNRYPGDTNAWAENMTYMWTFRGIPCLYYGSEIRFKAGADADKGPSAPLENTGRAYYGDNIEGTVTATDFGEYTNASGAVKTTLENPLPQHLRDLNKIRRAIPALQKGQYSNTGCDGSMAFKRRYVDDEVDSFVLVTISGNATFTNLPAGTYVDVVTGDSKTIAEGGSISTSGCSGSGNARIYVNTSLKGCEIAGKIAKYSSFLK